MEVKETEKQLKASKEGNLLYETLYFFMNNIKKSNN